MVEVLFHTPEYVAIKTEEVEINFFLMLPLNLWKI